MTLPLVIETLVEICLLCLVSILYFGHMGNNEFCLILKVKEKNAAERVDQRMGKE